MMEEKEDFSQFLSNLANGTFNFDSVDELQQRAKDFMDKKIISLSTGESVEEIKSLEKLDELLGHLYLYNDCMERFHAEVALDGVLRSNHILPTVMEEYKKMKEKGEDHPLDEFYTSFKISLLKEVDENIYLPAKIEKDIQEYIDYLSLFSGKELHGAWFKMVYELVEETFAVGLNAYSVMVETLETSDDWIPALMGKSPVPYIELGGKRFFFHVIPDNVDGSIDSFYCGYDEDAFLFQMNRSELGDFKAFLNSI